MSMSAVFVDERRAKCNHRSDVRVYDRCTSSAAWPQKRCIASRPVERGRRGRKKFPGPQLSWGPRVQYRINPWQATRLRDSNNSRPLPKNKFLFISVLSVLLVLMGPYWSRWTPRLHLVSLVGLMDKRPCPSYGL